MSEVAAVFYIIASVLFIIIIILLSILFLCLKNYGITTRRNHSYNRHSVININTNPAYLTHMRRDNIFEERRPTQVADSSFSASTVVYETIVCDHRILPNQSAQQNYTIVQRCQTDMENGELTSNQCSNQKMRRSRSYDDILIDPDKRNGTNLINHRWCSMDNWNENNIDMIPFTVYKQKRNKVEHLYSLV